MTFIPRSGVIREPGAAAAPPTTTPAPEATASDPFLRSPPDSYRGPLDDWRRAEEAAWPERVAAELKRLRAAKKASEIRAALEVAPKPLRLLCERVEELSRQRLDLLRHGKVRWIPKLDEDLTFFAHLVEGYELLIADFERDLPQVEQCEADQIETWRSRLASLVAKRQAAADGILAQVPALQVFIAHVKDYGLQNATVQHELAQMEKAGIAPDTLGIDLSAPLVGSPQSVTMPSLRPAARIVSGEIVHGLRIPGIAARGEIAPEWLYFRE